MRIVYEAFCDRCRLKFHIAVEEIIRGRSVILCQACLEEMKRFSREKRESKTEGVST